MLLRRGQCVTEERTVEECALLRRGWCVTEERTVCY